MARIKQIRGSQWQLYFVNHAGHWQWAQPYHYGDEPPHYSVPALAIGSIADLGERWSQWLD